MADSVGADGTTVLSGVALAVVLSSGVALLVATPSSGNDDGVHHHRVSASTSYMWHGTVARTPARPERNPIVVDVNGDGIDDAIGIVYPPGKEGHAHVGAFSGADAKPLWLSEKLGSVPEGIGAVIMLVAGDSVLATANDGMLHVLDIVTGKPRALRANTWATRLCASDDGLIAETGDDDALIWNPRTRTIEETTSRCDDARGDTQDEWPDLELRDFVPVSFEIADDRVYALGRTGRLEQPEVLAYDLSARRLLWRVRATGSEDVLAHKPWFQHLFAHDNGCVYVELHIQRMTDHGPRLTGQRPLSCFDEDTGERRWAKDHREHGSLTTGFVAGSSRLFWVRHERVDILDANGGESVGHIGWH